MAPMPTPKSIPITSMEPDFYNDNVNVRQRLEIEICVGFRIPDGQCESS